MRPVSADWSDRIASSHSLSIAATVIEPDGTETPLIGDDSVVTEGSVSLDGKADVRGVCSLTIRDPVLVPTEATDLLAPYANEIRIERGWTHAGTTERVTLGVFRIEDSDVDDSGDDLSIRVNGMDRSKRFVDASFEEAGSIAAGTNFGDAILGLLQDVWPDVPYDFTATDKVTPLLIFAEGDNVWAAAKGMAQAIGFDLYFDGDGECRLVPYAPGSAVTEIREVNKLADGTYDPDDRGATLLSVGRSWTRQGAFNRVVVTGENPSGGTIYRAVAIDDEPTSPTYYYGPFGKVTRDPYTSPYIISQEQADDAAAAILAQGMGTTQQVNFQSIVNPALEPSDVVTIKRERLGLNTNLILDSLTIPLDSGPDMGGVTRAVLIQ